MNDQRLELKEPLKLKNKNSKVWARAGRGGKIAPRRFSFFLPPLPGPSSNQDPGLEVALFSPLTALKFPSVAFAKSACVENHILLFYIKD